MNGLSDMEELLARIENKAMVDYMREAVTCYHGGAYRGCIVLSYIALFDDLAAKLHELAKTNKTAKGISKDVKQRQNDQQIFETYMVDKLKSAKLLTEPEASMLEQVRVCRNKAAHPSGVHASAEEARFVFFEVVDKFLSRPLLLTTQAVDALMGRLGNANFFPSNDIKETKDIVQGELSGLHAEALPYLTDRLVWACEESSQSLARNAQRFLVGLACLQKENVTEQVRKRLITAKADDPQFRNLVVRVASADPTVLLSHDQKTILRLRSLLDAAINNLKSGVAVTQLSHPVYLLGSMLSALGEELTLKDFCDFAKKVTVKYRYTGSLVKLLHESDKLKSKWVARMKEDAGSADFDTANTFAASIPEIDGLIKDLVKPKEALQILVAVCKAADIGAFKSGDLRAENFSAVPELRAMAKAYATKHPDPASKLLEGVVGSSRVDLQACKLEYSIVSPK